jgi:hypothetical protein
MATNGGGKTPRKNARYALAQQASELTGKAVEIRDLQRIEASRARRITVFLDALRGGSVTGAALAKARLKWEELSTLLAHVPALLAAYHAACQARNALWEEEEEGALHLQAIGAQRVRKGYYPPNERAAALRLGANSAKYGQAAAGANVQAVQINVVLAQQTSHKSEQTHENIGDLSQVGTAPNPPPPTAAAVDGGDTAAGGSLAARRAGG